MNLLPAEARLFFLAITPRNLAADGEIAALADSPIDWPVLAAIAERERMVSVMWRRLRELGVSVPPEVAGPLARRSAVTDFRMATTSAMLDRIVARLGASGIPSLLLKGAALARSVYPSFIERPMNDLDVLVPSSDAGEAWALMREDGWALELEDRSEFHADFHHLRPLVDPRGAAIVLELHRSMLPAPGPFVLGEQSVWRDAREVPCASTRAWIPSDVHQLLHLSVHFAWSHSLDHGVARSVRDIAALISRAPFDWDAFLGLAAKARASTCAFWSLELARALVRAPVPDDALRRLRPAQPAALTRALERAYIANGVLGMSPSVSLTHRLWSAGIHPRRSRHGRHRPWDATKRFHTVFESGAPPADVLTRLRSHVRASRSWLRFARVITSSRAPRAGSPGDLPAYRSTQQASSAQSPGS